MSALGKFLRSPGAAIGLAIVLLALGCALLASHLAVQNPFDLAELSIADSQLPPGSIGAGGINHWLGTDDQGRDVVARLIYGFRISVFFGLILAVLS